MDAITDLISSVNKNKFLSEFTFVEQKIDSQEGEEEIADCIIWFDDCIVLYQLKGRDTSSIADYSSEEKYLFQCGLGEEGDTSESVHGSVWRLESLQPLR